MHYTYICRQFNNYFVYSVVYSKYAFLFFFIKIFRNKPFDSMYVFIVIKGLFWFSQDYHLQISNGFVQ